MLPPEREASSRPNIVAPLNRKPCAIVAAPGTHNVSVQSRAQGMRRRQAKARPSVRPRRNLRLALMVHATQVAGHPLTPISIDSPFSFPPFFRNLHRPHHVPSVRLSAPCPPTLHQPGRLPVERNQRRQIPRGRPPAPTWRSALQPDASKRTPPLTTKRPTRPLSTRQRSMRLQDPFGKRPTTVRA